MLTPSRYWRVARTLEALQCAPDSEIPLPPNLAMQKSPPNVGDGILLAAYDGAEQTGIIRYLGLVTGQSSGGVRVDWRATQAEIWVDTPAGRGYWKNQEGFRFADTKVAGYGLHQMFADAFEGLDVRETLPAGAIAVLPPPRRGRRNSTIAPERLNPIEVIGEPTAAPRGGYVYVLQSAYGYKVGRTRNLPNRMRAFGVKLPIVYSIPLCSWFDDHVEAESAYHRLFQGKLINGEWFDLTERDVGLIRARAFK